jgi:hypothetical protein
MNFEKHLAEAVVEFALMPRKDEWGNIKPSPLNKEIDEWIKENKDLIAETIIKNVTVEKFSDDISKHMIEKLSVSSVTTWFHSKEQSPQDFQKSLRDMTLEKLSTMLEKQTNDEMDLK